MNRFTRILIMMLMLLGINSLALAQDDNDDQEANHIYYEINAGDAYVVREVTGDVTEDVMGVPAVPVDSFAWDGTGFTAVEGSATLELDPVTNTGEIRIAWTDAYGDWVIMQTNFAMGPVPLGYWFEQNPQETIMIEDDPIVTNVLMHGSTGAVDPTLPMVFAYAGTWGTAEVTLNGEPFENPYDDSPTWNLHTMTITGVYDEQGRVMTADGEIYHPDTADQGMRQPHDLEFQFILVDNPGPEVGANFPPLFNFAYHMVFEDVKIEINQPATMDG